MNDDHYILIDRTPVVVGWKEWGQWFENADRTVAKTVVDDATVSTVFLGLNYNFGDGEPLLFETMVFGGRRKGDSARYATWDEAVAGHDAMVASLQDLACASPPTRTTG